MLYTMQREQLSRFETTSNERDPYVKLSMRENKISVLDIVLL